MYSIVVLEKIDVFVSVQNSKFRKISRKSQMDIMFRIFMTIYVVKRKIGGCEIVEEEIKYKRVGEPNKDAMTELLLRAKGGGKTMKQFAAECGASQAAFSRIKKKAYQGPLTDKILKAIAEHANSESGVSLDALMAANGMERVLDSATVMRDYGIGLENNFIQVALLWLKRSERLISNESNMKFHVGTTFRFIPDLVVRVREEDRESYLWAFELIVPSLSFSDGKNKEEGACSEKSIGVYGRIFMEKMGRILPLFYNSDAPIGKCSFVVPDRRIFDYLVREYAEYYRVPFNISFMLYNAEKEVLEKEVPLKIAEGMHEFKY